MAYGTDIYEMQTVPRLNKCLPLLFGATVLHFITIGIVLLPLAHRRCCKCNANHCRTSHTPRHRGIESNHVRG